MIFVIKSHGFRGFTYMKNSNKNLIKGASILGIGAFLAKILGAVYRIPLTNLLGGYGIGLYQMIFPVYALLLDFSGAGLPSALSHIIAKEQFDKDKKAKEYLMVSLKLLWILGVIFAVLMCVFSLPISKLQGNKNAYIGYIFLSPSIFFVAIISCFRGYFQGKLQMLPTATSQIIEQVIKLAFGLTLTRLFLPNIKMAVAGATLAITLSEIFALIYLIIQYKVQTKKLNLPLVNVKNGASDKEKIKKIIKATLPITLIGIILPLSQVVDSFITINILSLYNSNATTLFGLYSGVALTIVGLPVSVCHGISTVAIPTVSAQSNIKNQTESAKKIMSLTLLLSLPCAIIFYIFAPQIISILYRSLGGQEKGVAINLLRLTCPCIVLLSVLQTQNGILIGKGKFYLPIFSLSAGVIIKIILNIILLNQPSINIYGSGIALIACYFFGCLINLFIIMNFKVRNENPRNYRRRYAN